MTGNGQSVGDQTTSQGMMKSTNTSMNPTNTKSGYQPNWMTNQPVSNNGYPSGQSTINSVGGNPGSGYGGGAMLGSGGSH